MTPHLWPFIIGAGSNAEAKAHRTGVQDNKPFDWIGVNASWEERRVFDWAYVGAMYFRSGDVVTYEYCMKRIEEIKERTGKE